MKGPKLTPLRLLGIAVLAALVASILMPSLPPESPERVLHGIALATSRYISDVGSFPRSLEDIRDLPALRINRESPTLVKHLPLEGVHYTPEFLGLRSGQGDILAYAIVPGQKQRLVLYYRPGDHYGEVVMRSEADCEAELAVARATLAAKAEAASSSPSTQKTD